MIVAATNRDLARAGGRRQFRAGSLLPLAAAVVRLPALRERLEDIPLLVPRLLHDLGHGDVVLTETTLAALRAHQWPGNVRELRNVLACALALVDPGSGVLEPRHLRFIERPPDEVVLDRLPLGGHPLAQLERAAIRKRSRRTRGNKVQAASALGIAPSTLYEKLKKYGL